MQENIYKRLAQAEAMAAAQKAETMEVLQAAYKRACEELNEEDAAAFARKIRNKLLSETDNRRCRYEVFQGQVLSRRRHNLQMHKR